MSLAYEVLEEEYNGSNLIKLTSGTFSGIIYSYGRVAFIEEGDQLRINFEYNVHNAAEDSIDKETFKQVIGDVLHELILEKVAKNELVYTGGIDENRTTDSEQSDSR